MIKQLKDNAHSFDQLFGILQHTPVIRCQIRLAFRTVSNNIIYLFRLLRRKLNESRETCAAHTDDPCFLDPFNNLFFG